MDKALRQLLLALALCSCAFGQGIIGSIFQTQPVAGGGGNTVVVGTPNGAGASTASSLSFTLNIPANTDEAVAIGCSYSDKTVTGETVTVGGTTASIISAATSTTGANNQITKIYALANPPTGASVTVQVSGISPAANVVCGGIPASHVNQSTPVINGTASTSATAATPTIAVTTAAGDLPFAVVAFENGTAPGSPSGTSAWSVRQNFAIGGAGQYGSTSSTPSQTFTWVGTTSYDCSGATFAHD